MGFLQTRAQLECLGSPGTWASKDGTGGGCPAPKRQHRGTGDRCHGPARVCFLCDIPCESPLGSGVVALSVEAIASHGKYFLMWSELQSSCHVSLISRPGQVPCSSPNRTSGNGPHPGNGMYPKVLKCQQPLTKGEEVAYEKPFDSSREKKKITRGSLHRC